MGLLGVLMSIFLDFFYSYILEISLLFDVGLLKIFSHSVSRLPFALFTVSSVLLSLLSFRRSHLLISALIVCTTGVIFRKSPPVLMHSRILPTFSSLRCNIIEFILRSLIHLALSLCMGIDTGLFAFFYILTSNYSSTIC